MLKTLFTQPLLQFLALGAVVFAADRVLLEQQDDPRLIVIDDARYAEIAGIYQDNQGHAPSEAQMSDLTIKWAQNELLYREARLMGLDKGDEMIRQRLILKLRNVLFNRVDETVASETELRQWFADHQDRYGKPATIDVEQFLVTESDDPESARTLAKNLSASSAPEGYEESIRSYRKRPVPSLKTVFNPDTIDALVDARDGAWIPIQSSSGWHLARIVARHAAQPASFESVARKVRSDWLEASTQEQLAETLENLAGNYDIRVRLTKSPEDWNSEAIENARLAMSAQ